MSNKLEDNTEMLEYISQQMYTVLFELYDTLSKSMHDQEATNDIVVNALAINLGHIIGQMDAKQQRRYLNLTRKTIKEYTMLGTIEKYTYLHGQIGHG